MEKIALKINKRFVFNTETMKKWLSKEIREFELIIDGEIVEKRGLFESNHSIGCNLEGYANILMLRGREDLSKILDEVASQIK